MIESESSTTRLKQELIDYVRYNLGDQIVDIELDAEHYETAYQRALGTYRQRAMAATEESYIFMELVDNVNIYTMPQEVQSVRQVYRRTFGNATGPFASNFDPFSQASLNVYLMNFNVSGGLATYDFYSQYVELAGRMFGAYIVYTFNTVTKKLQLMRDPKATGENVLLWTYNWKPEFNLLADPVILQWFRDFMVGACKIIIGEAREKYSVIVGPQGGSSLNGAAMKAEGQAAIDKCLEDLKNYVDLSMPMYWVIG